MNENQEELTKNFVFNGTNSDVIEDSLRRISDAYFKAKEQNPNLKVKGYIDCRWDKTNNNGIVKSVCPICLKTREIEITTLKDKVISCSYGMDRCFCSYNCPYCDCEQNLVISLSLVIGHSKINGRW